MRDHFQICHFGSHIGHSVTLQSSGSVDMLADTPQHNNSNEDSDLEEEEEPKDGDV
jgi:hypothetical protein